MRRIVVECKIDGVAAPLLIIVYRLDILCAAVPNGRP